MLEKLHSLVSELTGIMIEILSNLIKKDYFYLIFHEHNVIEYNNINYLGSN